MAIRDHFRFGASRKPSYVTSDAASGSSDRSNTSAKSNKSANPLKLAKSFSWKTDSSSNSDSSNDNGGMCNTNDRPEKGVPSWLKKKNKNKKDTKKKMHPSEKPLTLVNIQHQEMLSHFTWTFGNRRDSYDARSIDGVSPGTSRMPSFDGGSRPMPAGSPLAEEAGEAQEDGGRHGQPSGRRHHHEHVAHHDLFNAAFLSPDSAAGFARRAAVHVSE